MLGDVGEGLGGDVIRCRFDRFGQSFLRCRDEFDWYC
jgi:hypothetical protein